jgi:hypothetical protein
MVCARKVNTTELLRPTLSAARLINNADLFVSYTSLGQTAHKYTHADRGQFAQTAWAVNYVTVNIQLTTGLNTRVPKTYTHTLQGKEILDVCIWCTQKEEFVTPAESGQVFEMLDVNSWALLNSADKIMAHVNQDVLRYDCKRPRLMSTSSYRFFGDHVNS